MNEEQIRDAIIAKVGKSAAGADAAFIAEMFVDSFARRADLIVANGKLAVFEIKSLRDSLDRLEGQLDSYTRFFEQVTVVCAPKHVAGVEAKSLPHVGIWSISDSGEIKVVRSAKQLHQSSVETWLSFLPVDELRLLLREHNEISTGRRDDLTARAIALSLRNVRTYVLAFLKRREARVAVRIKRASTKRSQLSELTPLDERLKQFLNTVSAPALTAIPRKTDHSSKKSSASASVVPAGLPPLWAN